MSQTATRFTQDFLTFIDELLFVEPIVIEVLIGFPNLICTQMCAYRPRTIEDVHASTLRRIPIFWPIRSRIDRS